MRNRGLTLLELLICLLLVGLAAQLVLAPAFRQGDALVLRGIREEAVALFHRARMEARVHGEARLRFAEGSDPFLALPDGRPPFGLPLASRGVDLEIEGVRDEVELRYGPLGTAHFASTTLTLRRGRAETRLIVSGYGRVRR